MPLSDGAAAANLAPSGTPPRGSGVVAAWMMFLVVIVAAAILDVMIVSRDRTDSALCRVCCAVPTYARQIVFWLLVAALFAAFVWDLFGAAAGGSWIYGYLLEYLLSVDNLFVFQMVFKAYSTPTLQVERALFWGVSVAVVLRLVFFGVGTELLSMGLVARLIFGGLLVYSGCKTLRSGDDDEDDDPRNNILVRSVARLLPVHPSYSEEPNFFIRVADAPPESSHAAQQLGKPSAKDVEELAGMLDEHSGDALSSSELPAPKSGPPASHGTSSSQKSLPAELKLKVTPLFLVVVTLGVIDVVFAVDSVTAKISSVASFEPEVNFFLNLTSSAFAMFVLRSLYMVVDMLVRMFRYLNYGVGLVLVFIGAKLMLAGYVEIGMMVSCSLILAVLTSSMLASILLPGEEEADGEGGNSKSGAPQSAAAAGAGSGVPSGDLALGETELAVVAGDLEMPDETRASKPFEA